MQLPFNLVYLKYFFDAAAYESISKAAQKNFITQSAVSQAIKKLECALKVALITHQPNQFRLTYEGKVLFEQAKKVFSVISETESVLCFDDKPRGKVEFACTHSFALAMLPECVLHFRKTYPHIQIAFRLAHTDMIIKWLRKGLIDFGIVLDNEDFSAFSSRNMYQGRYALYYAKDKDPKTLPFLLSEELQETRKLKNLYREKYKKELVTSMEISSWELIANFAEAGVGIGFIPDYVAAKKPHLRLYDLGLAPITYTILAISQKRAALSFAADIFLNMLKKVV